MAGANLKNIVIDSNQIKFLGVDIDKADYLETISIDSSSIEVVVCNECPLLSEIIVAVTPPLKRISAYNCDLPLNNVNYLLQKCIDGLQTNGIFESNGQTPPAYADNEKVQTLVSRGWNVNVDVDIQAAVFTTSSSGTARLYASTLASGSINLNGVNYSCAVYPLSTEFNDLSYNDKFSISAGDAVYFNFPSPGVGSIHEKITSVAGLEHFTQIKKAFLEYMTNIVGSVLLPQTVEELWAKDGGVNSFSFVNDSAPNLIKVDVSGGAHTVQQIQYLLTLCVNSGLQNGNFYGNNQTPPALFSDISAKLILESRGWTVNIDQEPV